VIEATADVDPSAVVGAGTRIWRLAQVREDARLGSACILGRGAYVGPGVVVGNNVKIQNYALVYEPARLGDDVFIGPAVVFTNDMFPRSVDVNGKLKRADDWHAQGVIVRDGASIGARIAGVPARRIGWVGRAGERLVEEGDGKWRCPSTGEMYQELDGGTVPRVTLAGGQRPLCRRKSFASSTGGVLARELGPVLMPDLRPGLNQRRLLRLMKAVKETCKLDLSGYTVLTEAANGAYVVTPVLAAMAGAKVYALAAATPYATADELRIVTAELAKLADVDDKITFTTQKNSECIAAADIVANSGQVRPIDAAMISQMRPGCVIPLMYESWEYRSSDLDLQACRERGIAVAGTNEQHSDIDVFSYLGQMAIKQLHDAGIAVRGSRLVVLCGNSFEPYIVRELRGNGATVIVATELTADVIGPYLDAVLVAEHPGSGFSLTSADARLLRKKSPDTVVIQYWGEADREAFAAEGISIWPEQAPQPGHMGVLPSAVGPEAVIRLQAGGLKVGEVLARGVGNASPADLEFIQLM
jgi:hypothetical protein